MAVANPWRVEALDIIGYANVFDAAMLPSVAPPIFRLRSDPSRFFLPPYSFNAGYLCDPTEVTLAEIVSLEGVGEITVFPEAFHARAGFELFVDQDFRWHYEPRDMANATLTAIADRSISEAKSALRLGDLELADRLAGVAISADDRKLDPLAIKAAVRRARNDHAGAMLMAELAQPIVTEVSFMLLVDRMMQQLHESAAAGGRLDAVRSPMSGMASLRAA